MITIDLRKLAIVLLVIGAILVMQQAPDIQRYLRIRSMYLQLCTNWQ
ncbi:MAG: hypothetical protein PVSMB5_19590 [Ktedonobacteraceae bacterium]